MEKEFMYLNEDEVKMATSNGELFIKEKYYKPVMKTDRNGVQTQEKVKRTNVEIIEMLKFQIEGHEKQIEIITAEIDLMTLKRDLYIENPTPINPTFEFEKHPKVVESTKSLMLESFESKIDEQGKAMESSCINIDIANRLLTNMEKKR